MRKTKEFPLILGPMPVYTLRYRHKYGTDISVHLTERDALGAACAIILEFLHEIRHEETKKKILDALSTGLLEEAFEAWESYQGVYTYADEQLEISRTNLGSYLPDVVNWLSMRVMLIREKEAKEARKNKKGKKK